MKKKNNPLPSKAAAADVLSLGENVSIARRRRKMTQKEVAEAAGMTIDTIRRLEHGDSGVSIGAVAMVFLVLGARGTIGALLAPENDTIGLTISISDLPQRIRGRK